MTDNQLSRIDELTGALLTDLRLLREAFEKDHRFEIVKSIRQRIRKMEEELELLVQLKETEN